jgi:hypothetical protein
MRSYFHYNHLLHLSLFTALTSFLSTLLQLFLLFLFDRRIPFAGQWVFGDVFLMPWVDALYAFLWVGIPLKLYDKGRIAWAKLSQQTH